MGAWNETVLRQFADAEEIQIAPVRRNGQLRRATIIWAVRVGDALYVRSAHGADHGWHGVARTSRQARLTVGGTQQDVLVEDAGSAVLDWVDAAYGDKYGRRYASIVASINDNEHRATTLRLIPS